MSDIEIRPARTGDQPALATIAETADLFPADAIEPMIAPFLEGDDSASWLVAIRQGAIIGFAYNQAELMTQGTWNMRALAIAPQAQGLGAGRVLVNSTRSCLRSRGARLLIVDTSSHPEQDGACQFYKALGLRREAVIADYWATGEDKITFTLTLACQ